MGNQGRQDGNHLGEPWSTILGLSLTCGSSTERAGGRLEVGRLGLELQQGQEVFLNKSWT